MELQDESAVQVRETVLRVLRVLDGQPESDHRRGTYHLVSEACHARRTEAEDNYLHVRWFRNGNGHLTFKRPDLVDQINHPRKALPERARLGSTIVFFIQAVQRRVPRLSLIP